MGQIAQLLQERVGLSPDQASSAETEVIAFIRTKVPPQFQGMVDSMLGGSENTGGNQDQAIPAASGGLGGLLGEAESMFGKR